MNSNWDNVNERNSDIMYNNIVEANELLFKDKICDAISAYQAIIDNLINNSSL